MKKLFIAGLLFCFAGNAYAQKNTQTPYSEKSYSQSQKEIKQPDENQLVTHGSYTNSRGVQVHVPSKSINETVPEGATAKCRDGSYSFSQSHRGTCSHHHGVAEWL
ncbi:DUF3761 domain-containing protein [Acetobacteraceae bacterium]|nr:DUF3761 domain-containing protein [Acetobacteraceae bacterium]